MAESDGSDVEVGSESINWDDVTLDEARFVDAIERELEHAVEPEDEVEGDAVANPNEEEGTAPTPGAWVTDPSLFTTNTAPRYQGIGGATVVHPEDARPASYFELCWSPDVDQTNLYAEQQRAANPPPANATPWKPVDVPTLKAFIGLVFSMGVMRLPGVADYWRTSKRLLATNFGSVMSRDRFTQIWRYFHMSDNNTAPEERPDKLRKLRYLIDLLTDKFASLYEPHGDVTIDESIVRCKGRLAFRQYMPAKPIKWGIKVWALAESTTGYLLRFQVYTGKEDGTAEKGLSHRVVTDLTQHLQGTNISVYMDNFYTGVELLRDLKDRGILATGTVRSNRRGLPTQLLPKNTRLEKHQYQVTQNGVLSFCTWQDTKQVLVLSNHHNPQDTGTVQRRSGNNTQQDVIVPKMLSDYQQHMKGVDLCDQMIGYYMIDQSQIEEMVAALFSLYAVGHSTQ